MAVELALAHRAAHGAAGDASARVLDEGPGWTVSDVVCTSGPQDRSFEERHSRVSIAIVAAGTFQYRSSAGRALMTAGSLLLGNAGHCFECGHEHGTGDRCVAFHYSLDYFESIAAGAGARGSLEFNTVRLPPLRGTSHVIARACAGLANTDGAPWQELGVELAAQATQLAGRGSGKGTQLSPRAAARVTHAVRNIDQQ